MEELNKRNTEIIAQTLKEMYKKQEEQQIRMNQLNTTLGNLVQRLNSLETVIMMQKAKLTGLGPTAKE